MRGQSETHENLLTRLLEARKVTLDRASGTQENSMEFCGFGVSEFFNSIGCIAVVPQCFFKHPYLNVCFSRKRTLRLLENQSFQGQLSAKSRHCNESVTARRCKVFARTIGGLPHGLIRIVSADDG